MGFTNAIGNLFCQIRLLLLIAACLMIVGWASFYLLDSDRFTPKYKVPDNFWKYSKSDKQAEDKTFLLTAQQPPQEESEVKICPAISPNLKGAIRLSFDPSLTLEEVRKRYPDVKNGRCHPEGCKAQQRVAILIPHRNREKHLLYLLDNLHPLLQRQQLDYGIYVIHQAGDAKFNRAKLLNVGYLEALKEENWDCFILHDVDLVPENDFNTYLCDTEPKHLVVGRNVTGYKLWYKGYFGGVTAMTRNQFAKVNGYSNNYWGWGGEDDDLRLRVSYGKMTVVRPPPEIARYTMVFHKRDAGNEINNKRRTSIVWAEKTSLQSKSCMSICSVGGSRLLTTGLCIRVRVRCTTNLLDLYQQITWLLCSYIHLLFRSSPPPASSSLLKSSLAASTLLGVLLWM